MEQHHTINPLNIFWQSPTVRHHLTNAGTELMAAVFTGITELRSASIVQNLPAQYPYLMSAFNTVQTALRGLMGADADADEVTCDDCDCYEDELPPVVAKPKKKIARKKPAAKKSGSRHVKK